MKRTYLASILVIVLLAFCGCSNGSSNGGNASATPGEGKKSTEAPKVTATPQVSETPQQSVAPQKKVSDYIVNETMESKAISNNLVKEPTKRSFYVCLPPSYFDSDKKYPVVYYLHGQAESVRTFPDNYFSTMFEEFEKGAKEFILVCVDGSSNMGGAFYVNSPVSGNYEDYVTKEVVSYVDKNYRTIAKRDSRGICGFSMGGFGAYNLAFRHPDIYSSVLAMSPGALADGDMESAMNTWKSDTHFLIGYGRAFSPDTKGKDNNYANIPKMDNSKADQKIVKDWYSGFGDLNKKLDAYVALKNPLKAIKIIYGETDAYDWIPRGCKFLAKCMDARKIKYVMETHSLGHMIPIGAVEQQIVPFFGENLNY